MPLPNFSTLRPGLENSLQKILTETLHRDRKLRYQTANELMLEIEKVLYSKGYGPTNEKLASYMRRLYKDGQAYEDDLSQLPVSFALNPEPETND